MLYFLDRFDVTYTTPGKRDQVYIGKTDGEKLYKTNKYLFWTLIEVLDIVNGCAATSIQCEDSFVNQFGRKVLFRQLYEWIKFNKHFIYQNIAHATCLCEICENAIFFMQGLLQALPEELNLPSNPHVIVEKKLWQSRLYEF